MTGFVNWAAGKAEMGPTGICIACRLSFPSGLLLSCLVLSGLMVDISLALVGRSVAS